MYVCTYGKYSLEAHFLWAQSRCGVATQDELDADVELTNSRFVVRWQRACQSCIYLFFFFYASLSLSTSLVSQPFASKALHGMTDKKPYVVVLLLWRTNKTNKTNKTNIRVWGSLEQNTQKKLATLTKRANKTCNFIYVILTIMGLLAVLLVLVKLSNFF